MLSIYHNKADVHFFIVTKYIVIYNVIDLVLKFVIIIVDGEIAVLRSWRSLFALETDKARVF